MRTRLERWSFPDVAIGLAIVGAVAFGAAVLSLTTGWDAGIELFVTTSVVSSVFATIIGAVWAFDRDERPRAVVALALGGSITGLWILTVLIIAGSAASSAAS